MTFDIADHFSVWFEVSLEYRAKSNLLTTWLLLWPVQQCEEFLSTPPHVQRRRPSCQLFMAPIINL